MRPGTSADDLIASDPPPAFPPWMVEADPRLAAQDTNRIYQAFRRRRLHHPRTALQRWTRAAQRINLRTLAVWLWVLWMLSNFARLTNIIPLHYLPDWTPSVLIMLVVALHLASWWPRRKSARPTTDAVLLPTRLSAGFNVYNGSFDNAVLDFLVEVKARGSEVAEALYLEARERDRHALAHSVAGCLIVLPIFAPGLLQMYHRLGWHLLPPLVAVFGCLLILARVGMSTNRPLLRQLFGYWRKSLPRYATLLGPAKYWFTKEAPQIATMIGLVVGGTILLVFPVVGLAILAQEGNAIAVAWIVTVLVVLATLAIPPLARAGAKRSEAELEQSMSTADLLFDYHLGVVMHDDPDEVRALLIRRGGLQLDEHWSPKAGHYA